MSLTKYCSIALQQNKSVQMQREYSEDEISDISEDNIQFEEELASLESQLDREAVEVIENGLDEHTNTTRENITGSAMLHADAQNDFKCKTCGKTFFELPDLVRHIETHNKWRFKCTICGIYFKSKSSLYIHQQRHRAHKSFQCNTCEKAFITSNDLQNHVKIHQEQQIRYRCEVCGKDFGRIYTLRNHMNIHEPEPEFRCGRCQKIFPKRRNLLLHERTHLVEDSLPKVVLSQRHDFF